MKVKDELIQAKEEQIKLNEKQRHEEIKRCINKIKELCKQKLKEDINTTSIEIFPHTYNYADIINWYNNCRYLPYHYIKKHEEDIKGILYKNGLILKHKEVFETKKETKGKLWFKKEIEIKEKVGDCYVISWEE